MQGMRSFQSNIRLNPRCRLCRQAGHNILHCRSPVINQIITETYNFIQDQAANLSYLHMYDPPRPPLEETNLDEPIKIFLIRFTSEEIAILATNFGMKSTLSRDIHVKTLIDIYSTVIRRQATNMIRNAEEALRSLHSNEEELRVWKITPLMLCVESAEELKVQQDCPVCFESREKINMVSSSCNHEICNTCMTTILDKQALSRIPSCVICRGSINNISIRCIETFNFLREKSYSMVDI